MSIETSLTFYVCGRGTEPSAKAFVLLCVPQAREARGVEAHGCRVRINSSPPSCSFGPPGAAAVLRAAIARSLSGRARPRISGVLQHKAKPY